MTSGVSTSVGEPVNTSYPFASSPWGSTDHDHLCRCEGCAHPENLYTEESIDAEDRSKDEGHVLTCLLLVIHCDRNTVDLIDEVGELTHLDVPLQACNSTLQAIEGSLLPKWTLSYSQDPRARRLADRHYSRLNAGKPGSPRFVAPGKCLVLLDDLATALWVTLWQESRYTKHAWAGAWVCALFRNESFWRSSDLIVEAVAHTRYVWGEPPAQGMITFIDPRYVRKKRDWGRCYRRAGWHVAGTTRSGLLVLQLLPEHMPAPLAIRLPLVCPQWLAEKRKRIEQECEQVSTFLDREKNP
jgi:hypothetical protein